MTIYHSHRIYKRLRNLILQIITDFEHLPGGYKVWYDLSSYKKNELQKRWTNSFNAYLFDESFRKAALTACLTNRGFPTLEGKELYIWLIDIVYCGSEKRLYQEWIEFKKKESTNGF